MTNLNSTQPSQTSFVSNAARSVLGNRFGLLAIAAGIIGLSAYSSWGWLVAAGLAPILLSVAPCVAMCALGMCTMGGKSKDPNVVDATYTELPPSLAAPGAIEGTSLASNQSTQTKQGNKKGCC
jgi:hypothetical protein